MALSFDQWLRLAELGTGIAGAGLSAAGQSRANQQQLASNARQNAARLLQEQMEADRMDRLRRAAGVLQATQLGDNEGFATRARIARALLGAAQNVRITPGDPAVAAAMGTRTGGIQLPEGGLPPEVLSALSEEAIANAIVHRQQNLNNLDYDAAIPNLAGMGLPTAGGQKEAAMHNYATQRRNAILDQESRTRKLIQRALLDDAFGGGDAARLRNEDPVAYQRWVEEGIVPSGYEVDSSGQLKKKGGGFWGTLARIGLPIGLGILTGGMSLPAQIGIQAGAGALSGAMGGGGVRGALAGAAQGAATGAIASRLPLPGRRRPTAYIPELDEDI